MPTNPDREALIEKATERLRKQMHQQLPDDNATLDQIEEALDKIGKDLLTDLQNQITRKRAAKVRENKIECACGGQARYRNMAVRTLVTRHGVLDWKRPYYHCARCKRGFAPLDRSLGLDRGETTTAVRRQSTELAAHLGFAVAAEVLLSVVGIDLSASTIARIAVRAGTSLRQAQSAEARLHHSDRLPDQKTACPARLYIGADGVMTPLRDVWKKDGSLGDLNCRYGECKTGVVYQTHQDKSGRDSRVKTRAYVATLEGVGTFEGLLGTLAHRCGHHAAKEVVVLGDGAPWLWLMFGRLFPGAIQILDFYHASEHLGKVAEAIYGKGSVLSQEWRQARQAELRQDRTGAVLKAIAAWKPKTREHFKLRRTEFRYVRQNAERMRYKTFLAAGCHIGSGVVEAACKQVIAARLDQVGMHWKPENAEAILTLRASQLSTQPTDLKPHLAMAA